MKHLVTTCTRAILLMAVMLLLPSVMRAANEAWVGYDMSTTTLTFHYDENKSSSTATYKYSLNTGTNPPEWGLWMPYITKVVFDDSFKEARPTTCHEWFVNCTALTTIEGLKNLNTSKVTDMHSMFLHCSKLTVLDLTSFNTANVTDMGYMFSYCSSLKEINVSKSFTISDDCDASYMFFKATSLPGYKEDKDWDESDVNKEAASFYPAGLFYPERTAWVGYNDNTKTLTFHYDGGKSTSYDDKATYSLNTGINRPVWCEYNTSIQKVVFDESFAEVRPTTCDSWFAGFSNLTEIEGLENLNVSQVSDMHSMFYGCSSLTSLDLSALKTTAALTDAGGMFTNCSSLTKLDITGLNTSGVTDMTSMFKGCSKLKAIFVKDLFSVESLSEDNDYDMFGSCTSLPGYDENNVGKDKAKLHSEGGYFYTNDPVAWVGYNSKQATLTFYYDNNKYTSTDKTYDLNSSNQPGWAENRSDVKKVVFDESFKEVRPTSCFEWFYGCSSLTTIEGIENLNTSEVTDMSSMFYSCSSLTSVDLSSLNTSNVKSMHYMFSACSALKELKLSDQFVGTNVRLTGYMFSGCSSLKELDFSLFKTTSNLTNTAYMFFGCTSLQKVDLSGMTTTNVSSMEQMFKNCSNLRAIYVSDDFTVDNVSNSALMFGSCTSLPGYDENSVDKSKACYYPEGYFVSTDSVAWAGYNKTTKTLTFYYDNTRFVTDKADVTYDIKTQKEQPGWIQYKDALTTVVFTESFKKARPTMCYNWFAQNVNLTTIEGIENLNTSEVTDMSGMFRGCSSLTSLDLSGFNTAKVTTMSGMFSGCSALKELKLSDQFTGTSLTEATYVFNDCKSLTELDLSCLKTTQDKVYTLQGMFEGCTSLTSLNLSGLNTSKVNYMGEMFSGCSALECIYVSDLFTTTAVTGGSGMFKGCTSLPGFDASSVGVAKACYYPDGYFYSDAPKVWVGYNEAEQTLTFYYNHDYQTSTDAIYELTSLETPKWNEKKDVVTKVVFTEGFKEVRPTDCYQWFSNFKNLTTIEGIENLNTSEVTSMSGMFRGCSSLTSLDLSGFNTAKVTTMSGMFSGCSALKELKLSDQFTGTSLTEATYVFNDCKSLTELDLSCLKTTQDKVYTLQGMFEGCTSLTSLNLSGLNTSKVNYMGEMFSGCSALECIYVSDLFTTTAVTGGSGMFKGCTSLPGFDASSVGVAKACYYPDGYFYGNQTAWAALNDGTLTFYYDAKRGSSQYTNWEVSLTGEYPMWINSGDQVKKVVVDESFALARPTSCDQWFHGLSALTEVQGLEHLNTSKVTSMDDMFNGCTSLTSLDITTWDVSSLTSASTMFKNCSALSNIYVSEQFALPTSCRGVGMFMNCENLPNYSSIYDEEMAIYKNPGYLTLRRHFTVGDKQYNVDGYENPTCFDDVTFTDGAAYNAAVDFTFDTNKTASYTRTVKNHWATLCLPFTFSAENATAKFYSVKSYTNGTITATSLTGEVAAGTPVLAYVAEGTELSVSATGAEAVADAKQLTELKGAFAQTEVADNDYIIANDHFWNAGYLKSKNSAAKHVYVAPYRAYLTLANLSEASKPNSISINDDVTDGINGIAGAENLEDLFNGAELYDLQGRRLTAPTSGVIIVRKGGVSHKVVVK